MQLEKRQQNMLFVVLALKNVQIRELSNKS